MSHATSDKPSSPSSGKTVRINDLTVAAAYAQLLRDNGLCSLDTLCTESLGECLHKPGLDAWRERLRLTLTHPSGPQAVFLKRFLHPPSRARQAVRASGTGATSVAGLEWAWMRRLAADGIPTITPIAFGEELRDGREVRSAILSAKVPGDALERLTAQWGPERRRTVRQLLGTTADLVARFHRSGYVHRDLYLSHVFFDDRAETEEALHLIDVQRVMRPRWRVGRWIVKDLASLNYSTPPVLVTTADRVRWLKRYLELTKLDARAKRLIRQVEAKTRRIARHDRRRKARLQPGGDD